MHYKPRLSLLRAILAWLPMLFRPRTSLLLENLALRQQLAMFKRERPKPGFGPLDRAFWIALRLIWTDWVSTLVLIKPETVVHWHRAGFKRYWTLLSRRSGRPRANSEIRNLIRRMARENPTWGEPRDFAVVKQGKAWVDLNWKNAKMGGKPRIYRLERRQQPAGGGDFGDWMEIGTFIKTKARVTEQPRGVQLEYRVVAINSGGEAVSGVVDVVL